MCAILTIYSYQAIIVLHPQEKTKYLILQNAGHSDTGFVQIGEVSLAWRFVNPRLYNLPSGSGLRGVYRPSGQYYHF